MLLLAIDHIDVLQKPNSEDPLSPEEQAHLNWIYLRDMRLRKFAYRQYKAGLLIEDAWRSFRDIILTNHATKQGRVCWE